MKLFRIIAVLTVAAFVCAALTFKDAKTNLSGMKVSLTDPVASFSEPAAAEGTITFVYGPFATMERDKKTYNGSETEVQNYYYIVSDLDNGETFAAFSTSNKELADKLSDAADQWYDFLVDETGQVSVPKVSIPFSGMLDKPESAKDYVNYYNDAVKELGYTGIQPDEFAELTIYEGGASSRSVRLFFIYAGVAAAGIAALAFLFIRMRKNKQ